MLNAVDGVNSRRTWTIDYQVDRQDRVALPIDVCKLIQARPIQCGLSVVGCDGSHLVIEVRSRRPEHASPTFHGRTIPLPDERKVSERLMLLGEGTRPFRTAELLRPHGTRVLP